MKILVHSNAPWCGTGYGAQTELFAPRLKGLGHDVAISAFFGLTGTKMRWRDGINVYPSGMDPFGNDVVAAYALDHLGATDQGWVLSLCDVWVLRSPTLPQFNLSCWVPVDHDPVPPSIAQFFDATKAVAIAMSRFGQKTLADHDVDSLYVPHGINTEVFVPVERGLAREAIGVGEDRFVVGVNAANKGASPPRKSWPEILLAFKRFHDRHDDAILYLHTEVLGVNDGIDLPELAKALDLDDDCFRYVDQYEYRLGCPPFFLAAQYSAYDVLLNPSMGEGFGIPIVEAQACGTKVITNNFTAMPELTGPGSWSVGGLPTWDPKQKSWWQTPWVGEIVDALEEAYDQRSVSPDEASIDFAAAYDADVVLNQYWVPVLTHLEELIAPVEPTIANVAPIDPQKLDRFNGGRKKVRTKARR